MIRAIFLEDSPFVGSRTEYRALAVLGVQIALACAVQTAIMGRQSAGGSSSRRPEFEGFWTTDP